VQVSLQKSLPAILVFYLQASDNLITMQAEVYGPQDANNKLVCPGHSVSCRLVADPGHWIQRSVKTRPPLRQVWLSHIKTELPYRGLKACN